MKKFTSNELRNAWKEFYIKRGHADCGAVSLVSDGSTGAMFNVAGMQPIMPYLLGKKHPLGTRLCNVQGCVRTNDIESIGDKSHLTFFEMMGSWSLGDYFKKERCEYSFELLTEVFKFDRDHLAATVFAGDENAPRDEEGAKYRIASGFKPENVFYLPAEDNWWGLEYGPCGPDSEMFYVKDVAPCGPDCRPGCHCGKYTEIGNDVFMQYEKHEDGTLTPLAKKNVDTGWGLERNLAFLNNVDDVYLTDLFTSAIAAMEKASGIKYGANENTTKSMRIVADHLRTSVMLIGDPAKLLPSNMGAGYVLRRLIRRAVRHGRVLSLKKEDLINIASVFIDEVYAESYPDLKKNKKFILDELSKEIERFLLTLENGMREFKKISDEKKNANKKEIEGNLAFYLYDTFGFPLELTIEMAEEEGLLVDEEGFKESMELQKKKARENSNFSQKNAEKDIFESVPESVKSEFVGYDTLEITDEVIALSDSEKLTDEIQVGANGVIVTKRTPFYATMGGQKGDMGTISVGDATFDVTETIKLSHGMIGHVGKVTAGSIKKGDKCLLSVNKVTHAATCKNHTATHLLQKALQIVLGNSVAQAGSYQDAERTRFDFTYGKALTKEELERVEEIVNEEIVKALPVTTDIMSIEDAKKTGAMALFSEKYGETVRVVSIGDFSKELCGGTHVSNTSEIKAFKILSESGIAAGTRRIEAITDENVMALYRNEEKELFAIAHAAKCDVKDISKKIDSMLEEIKALKSENEKLKSKLASNSASDIYNDVTVKNGVHILAAEIKDVDQNSLKSLGDEIKSKLSCAFILLIGTKDGKISVVSMATDDAIKHGCTAGAVIKEVCAVLGGGGGGRPNMAQGSGFDSSKIPEALSKAKAVMENMIA